VNIYLIIALLLNPVQLILCNSIFSDILFQFLISFAFFFLLEFLYGKQTRYFLYYILFCLLSLLTKPVLVYYAYLNLFLALYIYFKIKKEWKIPVYSLILPLYIIIICGINEHVTGYYHYSASKVENLWTYNTTNFLNMKYGNDSGYTYKKDIWKLSKLQPDFKQQYQFVDSACKNVLKSNIKSYSVFHLQGILNFFIAPGREFINGYLNQDEKEPRSFIKELNVNGWQGVKDYFASQPVLLFVLNILVTVWNLLLLAGLFVFTFSKRVPLNIKIIILTLIGYLAGVSSLALGAARYKIAIYPVLLFANAYLLLGKNIRFWKRGTVDN
jgi:hypothetical protein